MIWPRHDPKDGILNLPEPLGELARAMQALCARGFALQKRRNGDFLLTGDAQPFTYFFLLEQAPAPRTLDWLRLLEVFGVSGRFPTREAAVRSIPQPAPPECHAFIKSRLADADLGVCRAACEAAGRSGDQAFLPSLIEIIATENHEWLMQEAGYAASALGGGLPLHQAWASRLADEHLFQIALDDLQTLIEGLPRGHSGHTDLTRAERIELRAHWQDFLQLRAEEIRQGKHFPLNDPALTPALFGRAREWRLPDGRVWPGKAEGK
jgi:hypothetical protein